MIRSPKLPLAIALAAATACTVPAEDDLADGADDSFLSGGKADDGAFTAAEARGVLALVNTATFTELDDDARLDRRAAGNIIDHRTGPDGVDRTDDDDVFDDLAELDAIPYVGPTAFSLLLAYAYDAGYIEDDSGDDCLIISEYIEGSGNYNKAIELFNCGGRPVDLGRFAVCLVRNDDETCSVTAPIDDAELPAGAVVTICRNQTGTFNDPMPPLRDACQLERPGVMTFNGDDRLVVFRDADNDGSFGAADTVMDALGRFGWRPYDLPWAEVTLRRCNLQPSDGYAFYDHLDYFAEFPRNDARDFGKPPTPGCL